jgi:hypothetical protein
VSTAQNRDGREAGLRRRQGNDLTVRPGQRSEILQPSPSGWVTAATPICAPTGSDNGLGSPGSLIRADASETLAPIPVGPGLDGCAVGGGGRACSRSRRCFWPVAVKRILRSVTVSAALSAPLRRRQHGLPRGLRPRGPGEERHDPLRRASRPDLGAEDQLQCPQGALWGSSTTNRDCERGP